MPENYYVVLGIPADSTQQDIKAAFRRLAKQSHPDLCPARQGRFPDIREAYAVLGDPSRRKEYDEALRAAGRKAEPRVSARAPRRAPSSERVEPLIPERPQAFAPSGQFVRGQEHRPDLDVAGLLERLFGGLSGSGRGGAAASATVEVALTPQQARRGGILRLPVPGLAVCPACGGSGGRDLFFACSRCGGSGATGSEYPLRIEFPPGLSDNTVLRVPLENFGRPRSWLDIRFRIEAF